MSDSNIFMHEIKNSLSNIYSLVEIIENDPKESRECLPLIKSAIKQIKSIESDYTEYIKSGKTPINNTSINLASILTSVAEEYKTIADERRVSIKISSKNIKVNTDAAKLRQVLSNLVNNAIKYNTIGGQVHLECRQTGDKPVIIISDTGIGMDQTEIASLGTMFYRSKKIEAPGTGLGWSLIKSIVSVMNWTINIRSKPNIRAIPGLEYQTTITLGL